jgi:hypothetical protein
MFRELQAPENRIAVPGFYLLVEGAGSDKR